MGRFVLLCASLAIPLSGCAVVRATGSVIGATGSLVSATANATAGAIDTVAGGGHKKKSDCAENGENAGCAQPASSK